MKVGKLRRKGIHYAQLAKQKLGAWKTEENNIKL